MSYEKEYLEKLAKIETPEAMYKYEQEMIDADYHDLRNAAQSLLENPEDEEAKEELSKLINELEIESIS